jgi:hypothetical protein
MLGIAYPLIVAKIVGTIFIDQVIALALHLLSDVDVQIRHRLATVYGITKGVSKCLLRAA